MERSSTLAKPALERSHVVIWRVHGLYLLLAFATYDDAEAMYYKLIHQDRTQHISDPSFEVYLLYYLAGYNDHDK